MDRAEYLFNITASWFNLLKPQSIITLTKVSRNAEERVGAADPNTRRRTRTNLSRRRQQFVYLSTKRDSGKTTLLITTQKLIGAKQ